MDKYIKQREDDIIKCITTGNYDVQDYDIFKIDKIIDIDIGNIRDYVIVKVKHRNRIQLVALVNSEISVSIDDGRVYIKFLIYRDANVLVDRILGIMKTKVKDKVSYYDLRTLKEIELSELEVMLAEFKYERLNDVVTFYNERGMFNG